MDSLTLPLGVLDQSPISEGMTGAQALRNSVELAQTTEGLGYSRYWVAEHHGSPMLAGSSPEIMISAIASATSRLRVGSGGVMLPHYSPLKVAENFSILSGLYPGRIDLGIGRAPGSDPGTAFALQRERKRALPDDFPEQMAELTGYLENSLPAEHPFARLALLPGRPEKPELWLLGSSAQSAIWAGELGLRYACADFINPEAAENAALYRERFRPSAYLSEPYVAVATAAICAPSAAEALNISLSARVAFILFREGRSGALQPPARAEAFLRERRLPLDTPPPGRRLTCGTPQQVEAGLAAVAAEYGAQELLIVTLTYDHAARLRSYALIAQQVRLGNQAWSRT